MSGPALFDHARAFARHAQHRTGTEEAGATLNWLEGLLGAAGGQCSRWAYECPFYDWRASVAVGGRSVDCLALYFEGQGEVDTDRPYIAAVSLANNYDKSEIAAALARAKEQSAKLAVLATTGKFPHREVPALIGCNADPATPKSGVPTLLVSGAIAGALKPGAVRAKFSATTRQIQAENLLARWGRGAPILITTPLTGWFSCAAERGSGIAVAIELARELSKSRPVALLATTGHELENLGLREQLKGGLGFEPRAVIHLGASMAACAAGADGRLALWPGRVVSVNRPLEGALWQALRGADFQAAPRFFGEGMEWQKFLPQAVPLLSFSGTFPAFHTPNDQAEATLTPELLEQVYRSVRQAVAGMA